MYAGTHFVDHGLLAVGTCTTACCDISVPAKVALADVFWVCCAVSPLTDGILRPVLADSASRAALWRCCSLVRLSSTSAAWLRS